MVAIKQFAESIHYVQYLKGNEMATLAGFKGGFAGEHRRAPTEQEIWDAAYQAGVAKAAPVAKVCGACLGRGKRDIARGETADCTECNGTGLIANAAPVAAAAPVSTLADCDIIAIANRHIEGWIANDKSVILECVTAAIREALRSAAAAPGADPMKLVQIRNVALEEAARICDDIELDPQPYASLAERAAEAIRERILITTLVPAQHIKTWQERAAELTSYPSPEQSYRLLQAEIDELRAVLAAAPAPAAEQKPVRYELRMCAEGQCDDWKPVSKERYETLTANGGDAGDGLKFEGRALYATPVAAAAPEPIDRVLAANQVYQKQVARIAELEAKLRQACDDRAELQACLHMTVSDDSPVAAAPGADDAKDAARYRYLRNASLNDERELDVCDDAMNVFFGEDLDMAIDDAMDAAPKAD